LRDNGAAAVTGGVLADRVPRQHVVHTARSVGPRASRDS